MTERQYYKGRLVIGTRLEPGGVMVLELEQALKEEPLALVRREEMVRMRAEAEAKINELLRSTDPEAQELVQKLQAALDSCPPIS